MKKRLQIFFLLLTGNAAFALPCNTNNYAPDDSVHGLAGFVPVSSVEVGGVLKAGSVYYEVISVVEVDSQYTLTTVELPNGPISPSGVMLDQCD